jgi:outer membrane protein assembly factor BamB
MNVTRPFHRSAAVAVALLAASLAPGQPAPPDWPQYGRGPTRVAATNMPAAGFFGPPVWITASGPLPEAKPFEPVGQASLVAADGLVIALGWLDGTFAAMALALETGQPLWASPVPEPVADSWSSAAFDVKRKTALIASGRRVRALALDDGSTAWEAATISDIVNASPLIAAADEGADRAFITDFGFAGSPGRLYAINLDAFDAIKNPYAPGQIVWSRSVGPLSGASPTLAGDLVIVATGDGRVMAFDAAATQAHDPIWSTNNPTGLGFFGGVSVRDNTVFAGSYAFFGGQTSANLLALDAASGAVRWTIASNRTSALPIPMIDGRIVLSTGIGGFGSQPSLQVFDDLGTHAVRLMDTFLDGGPTAGFWTHTPVVLEEASQVIVAMPPAANDPFGPSPRSLRLDLDHLPHEPGFVVETFEGFAISAATSDGTLLGAGAGGIAAYRIKAIFCDGDFNQDGVLDIFDLLAYLGAFSGGEDAADLIADGILDFFDVQAFLALFSAGCPQ